MADDLARLPEFAITPSPRCYHADKRLPRGICGAPARWKRPGNHWFADEFFCDQHRATSDVQLVGAYAFRRIRVKLDVLLAAAHIQAPHAQTEAVLLVDQLLTAAGAVLDIHGVQSTIGKAGVRPGTAGISGELPPRR